MLSLKRYFNHNNDPGASIKQHGVCSRTEERYVYSLPYCAMGPNPFRDRPVLRGLLALVGADQ